MQRGNKDALSGFNIATTIGGYMISSIAVGIFLGRWADGYFGSQPWATIAGIVLGMVAGIWAIYKKIAGGI